jgi:hypothetical protein
MASRRNIRADESQLSFEALSIEGALLSPEWLAKVAQLSAAAQAETDYRVPKGLNLRDEIGRYWRIAQALWTDYAAGLAAKADRELLAENFVTSLLRDCFGFASLARIGTVVVSDRNYPIGQIALGRRVPVVIAPAASGIDTLSPLFADGGRRRSAFGAAQEYLNAEDSSLWGIATDGSTLRILRDNASLTRPAWIEADLARIFTEERYADFAALWLVAHETRFGRDGQAVTDCALEAWRNAGREEGTRARAHLRGGVEDALVALGQGFLAHPENQTLRAALQDGSLTTRDYFSQLLRLVYRLIFLLTVEERDLLHPKNTSEATQSLYRRGYGLRRLSEKSVRRNAHDRHADLWESLKVVLRGLTAGESRLGLPALAGIFAAKHCPYLDAARLENRALLLAIFKLAWLRDDGALVRVNWRDMGPEELGSVYESLLELVPQLTEQGRKFSFVSAAGNERKTTGSYYTPTSLVECLLDSALKPVVEERLAGMRGADAEKALLSLRVCDPACGSGHFLIAAARRLARRLASIRAENEQPSLAELRHAIRDVIGHCIYGVDLNPMAVELCKITLWLEALEPGKPLSFLDHHVQCGNSLLGATPRLLDEGLPDDAFKPIAGDDKVVCTEAKKRNKEERTQLVLFHGTDTAVWDHLGNLPAAMVEVDRIRDDTAAGLHAKEERYTTLVRSIGYLHSRFLADAWCAAFVWKKTKDYPYPITNDVLRKIERNPHDCAPWMRDEIQRLREQYQFFHWHLAFPEVFPLRGKGESPQNKDAGWNGGFDVMLGNPPWERTALEELEFFARNCPEVLSAPTTAVRKQVIQNLRLTTPQLFEDYSWEKRKADCEGKFFSAAGLYPLGAQGRLNTYALFANLGIRLLHLRGRLGMVLQSGLACDAPMEDFWRFLIKDSRLVAFIDFENKNRIFQDVHPEQKFALVSFTGSPRVDNAPITVGFWLQAIRDLKDTDKVYGLNIDDLEQFSPNTGQPLLTRRRSDVDVLRRIFSESDICWHSESKTGRAKAWVAMTSASFSQYCQRESDLPSGSFQDDWNLTVDGRVYSPLLEAKQIEQYDFCFATYEGVSPDELAAGDPNRVIHADGTLVAPPKPRFWADKQVVSDFLISKNVARGWCFGYRDVTNVNNERTAIATVLPRVGFLQPLNGIFSQDARTAALVLASINSLVCDFVARLRFTGRHLNVTTFSQLPIPKRIDADFVVPRVVELTYTGACLRGFANECGYWGEPYTWNSNRRFHIRCELDAALAHYYRLTADDLVYICDTFHVLKTREEREFGRFRSRETVLELFETQKMTLPDVHD